MEIKITKTKILDYSNGSAYGDAYKTYLVYGKIYNDDNTRYRPFKYVYTVFKDDLFAYDDYPDYMSLTRQKAISNEFIYSFIDCNYPTDYNNCKAFFNACNDTIFNYNKYV